MHDNNIYANQLFGVYSDAPSFIVNAHWNWWGHESGPYHSETNPGGAGNGVSDGVEYRPWQTGYVSVRVEAISSEYQTFGGASELRFRITNSGDVNGDGIVNILDAVLVANCVICCWDPVLMFFGDCYRDEFFNILDLLGIANQILGISTCEP